jgi:Domain of unknown function (DUF5667)/Putative zinc-finger
MLSHATARDWLIPYADGMLAADERRRIDGHIAGCSSCAGELRQVRELNLLVVSLPPAPPTAFAPFWLKLQAVLPQRGLVRLPSFLAYRRVGLAFAMAAVAILAAAGTALAAPAALPDSPLYSVKQIEEGIRLATTPTQKRLAVQMDLANERLYEAKAMAANHKPLLAADTLRAYQVIVNDTAAQLQNPADPKVAKADLRRLRVGLAAVERENALKDDDDSDVRQLVVSSTEGLDRIENPDGAGPTLIIGTQATPNPSPAPKPLPTIRPTPKPSDRDYR